MREGSPGSRRVGPKVYLTVVQRLGAAGDLTASRRGARHLGPMALTRHRRKHSQDKKNGSPADDGTGPQSTRKGKVGPGPEDSGSEALGGQGNPTGPGAARDT